MLLLKELRAIYLVSIIKNVEKDNCNKDKTLNMFRNMFQLVNNNSYSP